MRYLVAGVLVGLLMSASASPAMAGGYELGTDQGGEALARAGAATAYSHPMSLYSNIAGIADIPRYMVYITDNMTFQSVAFRRAPDVEQTMFGINTYEFDPVENETRVFPLGVGLAGHIRLTDYLVLSLGAHGPTAVGWGNWPEPDWSRTVDGHNPTGAARHDLTHMDVVLLWPSVGLGLTVPRFENLRIGASFQPGFVHMAFTNYADAEAIGGEVRANLSVWDPFVPGGQIGFLLRAWRFDIGLQVRLSDSIDAEGDVLNSADEAGHAEFHATGEDPVEVRDATAGSGRFQAPWPLAVVRFGLRYAHPRQGASESGRMPWQRELFDIEADFIFESNSMVDEFNVTLQDVTIEGITVAERQLRVPHNWENTYGVRLGGSFHILRGMLTVSAGVSWESNSVPLEWTRLDYLGWMHVGLAFGVTLRISVVELTLAYQHIFMPDRTVSIPAEADPRSDQYDPDFDACAVRACAISAMQDNAFGHMINAGDYEASYDILTFSLGFRWGEGSGRYRDEDEAQQDEPPADEEAPAAEPEPAPEPEPESDLAGLSVEEPTDEEAAEEEPLSEEPAAEEPTDEESEGEELP